jgi:hypothetical protein
MMNVTCEMIFKKDGVEYFRKETDVVNLSQKTYDDLKNVVGEEVADKNIQDIIYEEFKRMIVPEPINEKQIVPTPLLIVRVPIDKMPAEKAWNYMIDFRDKLLQGMKHEYNLIVIPSNTSEFVFESAFSSEDIVNKVLQLEDVKKVIGK